MCGKTLSVLHSKVTVLGMVMDIADVVMVYVYSYGLGFFTNGYVSQQTYTGKHALAPFQNRECHVDNWAL